MNLRYTLGTFFSSSLIIFAMSSCADKELSENNHGVIPQGNGIVFGANASYAGGAQSRTDYGDYETDPDGNKISQKILWLETDHVDIYSEKSPNYTQVVYGIQKVDGKDYLLALGDGLQWDYSSQAQDFYAVYPSKNSIKNEAIKNLVNFENGVLTGYVPVNQQHNITKEDGKWVAKPNMDYLYMAAVAKNYPIPTDPEQSGISLDFVPLTTTLEVTFVGPTEAPIASFNVFAPESSPIAGSFTCNLAGDLGEDGYPICNYSPSSTVRNMITVTTYYEENGRQKPIELADGETITFNIFLLPHQNLTDISLRVAGFNTASRTMTLAKGENKVVLQPHKKTCVKVAAPRINTGETNYWLSGIDDKVLVSQLSIPGTANSFSYLYNDANSDWYKTQSKTIIEQWNAGIRCFELKCPQSSSNTLEDSPLQCNRKDVGITFGEAVDQIWELVQGTSEFAMIIPAFESNSGRGEYLLDFVSDLNNFFLTHGKIYKFTTYDRNLIVKDARGSLMFISRITSEEDGDLDIGTPEQGVFIHQWGSLKDNWKRRGYPVDNWGRNSNWGESCMEYYMLNGGNIPDNIPVRNNQNVDFKHTTIRQGGSKGSAYIQDWSRVVKTSGNYLLFNSTDYWGNSIEWSRYAYWKESKTEKENDVWNTFLLAIEDNSNQQGSTFYINSLDGYYVDQSINLSCKPYVEGRSEGYRNGYSFTAGNNDTYSYGNGGVAGNIAGFATDINNYFYNEILKYGVDNIYGPMNIILLDRVYEEGGGSYLPSVIIINNYRFPLITIDDISNSGQKTDSSYEAGGSIIK